MQRFFGDFFKMVKNTEIFQSGEKYEDFSKWSYCNGRPAHMKNTKISQSDEKCESLIIL